jgi:hypothetical protein
VGTLGAQAASELALPCVSSCERRRENLGTKEEKKVMDFENEEYTVTMIASRLDHLETSISEEKAKLKEAEALLHRTQAAQEILQLIAQAVQQKAHERISAVVTSCLQSVFGKDAYAFKIVFERKRGRTEASLRFTRGDLDVDPMTASGGGVVDVAAFALRVACLMLHRPRLSKLIVLDEPFKFVSADYRDNVRLMLEELSEDLGLQIVMVTHIDELETGKIIRL